jgi:MFS family permease
VTRLRERLARTPPGYRFSIGRILAIYSGLMIALMLAALDQTIVATALPRVVSELGGITQYSWVFTAYMLGATVTVPLYGQLGDIYGRKPLFIVAITIFLVGSALCGAAQNMVQLVIFRAVQGVGAGGIFPLTLAMIGMIVPPRDRGRYQGLIGSVFAAASIAGPLIGGFIVDTTSWRWIFFVNLPVGIAALAVILVTMPRRATRREHSIDWLGAAVLGLGTTSLLLGLVWGGRDYPWGSPQVQGVIGTSATSSGVVLTPLLLGAVITSFVSGQIVSRTGRYRPNTLIGPVVLGLGEVLLWRMGVNATNAEAARNMVIVGIGLGMMMQIFVLSIQNSVPRAQMGAATALSQFSRSIGATLGVTLMGVIVNQQLPASVRDQGTVIHRLRPVDREALANALHPAFLLAAGLCALVFVISLLWVREQPLRRGLEEYVGDEASSQPAVISRPE